MDLWEYALGFMNSQILLTAEELGVFASMAHGPRSTCEIAAATGLPEDSTKRLLVTLCAMGIVHKLPDGRFVNGPEASEQLVPGKPRYIGALFHHLKYALYATWGHFKEALYEQRPQWERAFRGQSPPNEGIYSDPQALRSFIEGMHTITYQAAAEFAAAAVGLEEIDSIVDVGGASGAFVIALAQRYSGLRGIVLDLPPVRPIAEDFLREHGIDDRVSFHAANFWEERMPPGADAYSLGFILHDWDTEGGSILLRKIADAAPRGGLLIIGEYLLDEERTGPLFVARSDLNMLVAARGRERTAREYREWIRAFGFDLQQIHPTSQGKHFLVAQRG